MVARDEETGVWGVFPVTAVSSRQATDVLWLTLEKDAATTRMGVTSAHPLFVAGDGWVLAGDLVPGDAIRASDLRTMRVLAVEMDANPQLAYKIEVAGAHTYFAGELEAWGHNAKRAPESVLGTCSIDADLDFMVSFLGTGYSDEGDGRYRSADARRQARLGDHETRNPKNLHCHVEQLNDRGEVVVNFVIKLVGKKMPWYRIAWANYDQNLATKAFSGTPPERIPMFISLETSKEPSDESAINLIYYRDRELSKECGDFFFTSKAEAFSWSEEVLGLPEAGYQIFDPPEVIESY